MKYFGAGTHENEAVEKGFRIAGAMGDVSWAVTEEVLGLFKEGVEKASRAGFDLSSHWN